MRPGADRSARPGRMILMIRWFVIACLPTWIIAILSAIFMGYLFVDVPAPLYYLCTVPAAMIPCIVYYEKIIKSRFVIGVDKAAGRR